MQATTIKLEAPLLKEIYSILPSGTSLTYFVREAIKKTILQKKMEEAATAYVQFLENNSEATLEMDEWENAPLDHDPKIRSKTGRTK